jgi:hypothetical protein
VTREPSIGAGPQRTGRGRRSPRIRSTTLALAALAYAALGVRCPFGLQRSPGDRMLHLDPILPTGEIVELPHRARPVLPGPDGELGTGDDLVFSGPRGDVDVLVRTGITQFTGPFPPPSIAAGTAALPAAESEPFAEGAPIPFVVAASDGRRPPAGAPVVPPSLEGAPVLVLAFPDLDADGYVGVTELDGDAGDAAIEEEELRPVGRRFAPASAGRASGELFLAAGGPAGAELLVALCAAAYAGPFDPQHFGGAVPDGPAVMTRLPFLPRTDPDDVIDGNAPGDADPDRLVGVEVEPAFTPDPAGPLGESYTLRASGADASIDFARSRSGALARFGLARAPDPASYRSLPGRPLRPGLGGGGKRQLFEVVQQLALADDGAASTVAVRVVPLDRLGNVTGVPGSEEVTLLAGGGVAIAAPDADGDPAREVFDVANARGVAVTLDDAGAGILDDADGTLRIESSAGLALLEVFLPDPDVDDSGSVDAADVALVAGRRGAALGEAEYEARLDLSGDGRIHDEDAAAVQAALGANVPVP